MLLYSWRWLFFFNDTAPPEIYTLSLPDALPISGGRRPGAPIPASFCRLRTTDCPLPTRQRDRRLDPKPQAGMGRSEEHTSELQSRQYLVCRLLLEKKTN